MKVVVLCTVVGVLGFGCGSETEQEPTPCEVAATHIETCTGEPVNFETCEGESLERAVELTGATCEELAELDKTRNGGKSDGALCDWFNVWCNADEEIFTGPTCESDADCMSGTCVEAHCFDGIASDQFAAAIDDLTGTLETSGNSVVPLIDNVEAMRVRRQLMEDAEHSIHFTALYIVDDEIGRETLELCRAAVARGVEVRMILDHASMLTSRTLYFVDEFAAAGVDVVMFNPLFQWSSWELTANNRLHQKIMVVDGEAAIEGGRNWANYYLKADKWRDIDVFVMGPAVDDLQRIFLLNWDEFSLFEETEGCPQSLHCVFEGLADEAEYYRASETDDTSTVRAVLSEPWLEKGYVGYALHIAAIRSAKEEILIYNAYSIVPRRMRRHLLAAADRGVSVKFITNSYDTGSPQIIWYAAANYYRELVAGGVEIYEKRGGSADTMHAKAMVVDGEFSIVSSWNIDPRSVTSNSESIVTTRGSDVAQTLRNQFVSDLESTDPVRLEFTKTEIALILANRLIEPLL